MSQHGVDQHGVQQSAAQRSGVQQNKDVKREAQLHYEEGKSPAAWIGSLTALVGFFIVAGGSMMGPSWTVIYLGCAVIALAAIATVVLKSMGYGTPARDL